MLQKLKVSNIQPDHGALPLLKRSDMICDNHGFCRYQHKNWFHVIWASCLALILVGLISWLVFTHRRRRRKMGGYVSRYSEPLPKYMPADNGLYISPYPLPTYSETQATRIVVRAPEPAYTGVCVPIQPPSYHSSPRGSEGV